MEVWEAEKFLFKRRAGTPAPNLLKDVRQLKGIGELSYPADSSDVGTGVDVEDKPPYPLGKYLWTSHTAEENSTETAPSPNPRPTKRARDGKRDDDDDDDVKRDGGGDGPPGSDVGGSGSRGGGPGGDGASGGGVRVPGDAPGGDAPLGGGGAAPSGTLASGLFRQVVTDMIGLMEEQGPELFGFEKVPTQPAAIEGDVSIKLWAPEG